MAITRRSPVDEVDVGDLIRVSESERWVDVQFKLAAHNQIHLLYRTLDNPPKGGGLWLSRGQIVEVTLHLREVDLSILEVLHRHAVTSAIGALSVDGIMAHGDRQLHRATARAVSGRLRSLVRRGLVRKEPGPFYVPTEAGRWAD